MNKNPIVTNNELHPIPVHSPWYHVAIDFVSSISPTSSNGIISLIIEQYPHLPQIFMRMGLPKLLTSDHASKYTFEQRKMRDHLHSCLNKGTFSVFSTRRVGRKVHKITNIVQIAVYCKCRMPEIEDLKMIQCSTCSEWYHINACVQVSEEVIKKKIFHLVMRQL